jgi:hypothetical protein
MRTSLFLTLTACFCFAACADHRGDLVVVTDVPQTPVNRPDNGSGTSNPPASGGAGETSSQVNNGTGSGAGSGGEPSGGGGSTGQSSGGSSGGGNGGGGGTPPSGPEGSQPVPEPSTLILVGTGLAAATLLRRRKQSQPEA